MDERCEDEEDEVKAISIVRLITLIYLIIIFVISLTLADFIKCFIANILKMDRKIVGQSLKYQ